MEITREQAVRLYVIHFPATEDDKFATFRRLIKAFNLEHDESPHDDMDGINVFSDQTYLVKAHLQEEFEELLAKI